MSHQKIQTRREVSWDLNETRIKMALMCQNENVSYVPFPFRFGDQFSSHFCTQFGAQITMHMNILLRPYT